MVITAPVVAATTGGYVVTATALSMPVPVAITMANLAAGAAYSTGVVAGGFATVFLIVVSGVLYVLFKDDFVKWWKGEDLPTAPVTL